MMLVSRMNFQRCSNLLSLSLSLSMCLFKWNLRVEHASVTHNFFISFFLFSLSPAFLPSLRYCFFSIIPAITKRERRGENLKLVSTVFDGVNDDHVIMTSSTCHMNECYVFRNKVST